MKKLLFVLAIATFAACGDSTSETTTEETTTDTSTMVAPATGDTATTMGADTATTMGADTTRK